MQKQNVEIILSEFRKLS